jgi:hypothetical protein
MGETTEKISNINGKMGNKLHNKHMNGKMAGEMGTATKKMGDMAGKIESMTN